MKLNLDYDELPWLKQLEPTKVKTYKFTSANRTIEFHSMELDDMDGYDMCNHILNVKHTISQLRGRTQDSQKVQAAKRVVWQELSRVAESVSTKEALVKL